MQEARSKQDQTAPPLIPAIAGATAEVDTRPSPPCPHQMKALTELAALARQVI